MKHLNGNMLCAVDVETTGLIPGHHEIVQVAIIPLTPQFVPIKVITPFCMYLIPEHFDRWDPHAAKITGINPKKIAQIGMDQYSSVDALLDWFEELPLHVTKWGNKKRLQPIGHNFIGFDKQFLINWLGREIYDQVFDHHERDTLTLAHYLNDRAAIRGEKVPFPKQSLSWLCNKLGVQKDRIHDAQQDALLAAKIYAALLQYKFGLFS